jgi:hypothetical protein
MLWAVYGAGGGEQGSLIDDDEQQDNITAKLKSF